MPPRPTKPQPTPLPEPDRRRLLNRCLQADDLHPQARAVTGPPWLFPGRRPDTHRDGLNFTRLLAAEGIDVRAGRAAALMALAEQLPATVLGPLLGLATTTAANWTRLVQRDWTDYRAARTLPA
jgi:hypothetical protein